MIGAEQMPLLLSLQREIGEIRQKNEDKICVLWRENKKMKQQLTAYSLIGMQSSETEGTQQKENLEDPSTMTSPGNKSQNSESQLNQFVHTFDITGGPKRHHFNDEIKGAQLPLVWEGLNVDRYDEITNLDEHMDIYTTHMSLFTSDDSILCRVFPTSLKGETLS